MLKPIKKASTDQSVIVRVIDSTDGTPETAVAFNTAGVDLWYRREGAVSVDITEVTLATVDAAHADGGFIHINDGYCRLDLPDAACAAGANGVMIGGTFTGMIVIGCYVPLVDYDPYDTVRLGLTALPNAAADAAGGVPISDAGGLDIDTKLANTNEVTVARMGALTDWINGGRLDLLLDAIPTTAMRGTDSAALASVCTEGRLAELDAANVPADVDTLLSRITAAVALASALATHDTAIKALLPAALVSGRMSSDAVAISGSTDAADKLEASAETIVEGAAAAGTLSTTQMTTNLAEVTNDHYNGCVLIWKDGVLKDQRTNVTDYDGATKMLTFTAVTEAPGDGDLFVLL